MRLVDRAVNNTADGKPSDSSAFIYEPDTALPLSQLADCSRASNCIGATHLSADCSGWALKPEYTTAERHFLKRHLGKLRHPRETPEPLPN